MEQASSKTATAPVAAFSNVKLTTEELAVPGKVLPQSIRAALCRNGHWMGMRPVKLPNGRLLWDAAEAARVLNGEEA